MNYGCCTVCGNKIEDGSPVTITGITITSGGFSSPSSSETHYAHATCRKPMTASVQLPERYLDIATGKVVDRKSYADHVRDAIEANR